jgi:hypothetical protein
MRVGAHSPTTTPEGASGKEMTMSEMFLPIIKGGPGGPVVDVRRAARRELRAAFEQSLRSKECAEAIQQFKCNGMILGHKVLDNNAALHALIGAAPKVLADQMRTDALTEFEKQQVLDQALRRYFEMTKDGKLTGREARRLLKQQPAETAAVEESQPEA